MLRDDSSRASGESLTVRHGLPAGGVVGLSWPLPLVAPSSAVTGRVADIAGCHDYTLGSGDLLERMRRADDKQVLQAIDILTEN